jgi:hypothetical protein
MYVTPGSIYTMLYEVHRLLKVGGVYMVFSLNTENLLAPLLGCPALGFQIDCHKICRKDTAEKDRNSLHDGKEKERSRIQSEDGSDIVLGTVAICKKTNDTAIDLCQLAEEEKVAMDNYFKVELPFLTEEQEQKIRMNFEGSFLALNLDPKLHGNENDQSRVAIAHDDNWRLSLDRAYLAMFEGDQNLEYSYELFLEDVHSYPLAEKGYMTVEEALSFLQMMQ